MDGFPKCWIIILCSKNGGGGSESNFFPKMRSQKFFWPNDEMNQILIQYFLR